MKSPSGSGTEGWSRCVPDLPLTPPPYRLSGYTSLGVEWEQKEKRCKCPSRISCILKYQKQRHDGDSTASHFFHCGYNHFMQHNTDKLQLMFHPNIMWKKTIKPAWPVLVMDLMACLSSNFVKVKASRCSSTTMCFVSMLMGDWLSPPHWESGRRCHWDGLYSEGRGEIKV